MFVVLLALSHDDWDCTTTTRRLTLTINICDNRCVKCMYACSQACTTFLHLETLQSVENLASKWLVYLCIQVLMAWYSQDHAAVLGKLVHTL